MTKNNAKRYAPEWSSRLHDAITLRDELGGILPTIHASFLSGLSSRWRTSPVTEMLGCRMWPAWLRDESIPRYISFDWWSLGKRFDEAVREKRYASAAGELRRFADGLTYAQLEEARGGILKALAHGPGGMHQPF